MRLRVRLIDADDRLNTILATDWQKRDLVIACLRGDGCALKTATMAAVDCAQIGSDGASRMRDRVTICTRLLKGRVKCVLELASDRTEPDVMDELRPGTLPFDAQRTSRYLHFPVVAHGDDVSANGWESNCDVQPVAHNLEHAGKDATVG